jgi:hypothetical protein
LNREATGKILLLSLICLINWSGVIVEILLSGFLTINLSSEVKIILGGSISTIGAFGYLINFFLHASLPIVVVDSLLDCDFLPYEKNKFTKQQLFLLSSLTNIIGKTIVLLCMNPRIFPIMIGITIIFMAIFYLLGLIKPIKRCLAWIFGTQTTGKLRRIFHGFMGALFCLFCLSPFFWFVAVQFISQNFSTPGVLGNYAFFTSFYAAMLVIIFRLICICQFQRNK